MKIINGLHAYTDTKLHHFSDLVDITPKMPTFQKLLEDFPQVAEILSRFEGKRLELARAIAYSLICPFNSDRAIANYLDLFPVSDIPDLVTLIVLINPDVTIYTNRDDVIKIACAIGGDNEKS